MRSRPGEGATVRACHIRCRLLHHAVRCVVDSNGGIVTRESVGAGARQTWRWQPAFSSAGGQERSSPAGDLGGRCHGGGC